METRALWLKFFLSCAILVTFVSEAVPKDDWNTVLEKARQEGSVAVFGGTTVGGLKSSVKLFKEKFGIDLLLTTGRSSSTTPKLLQERRSGLYLQDVMISGQTSLIDPLKKMGVFDPVEPMLVLPEVVDQKLWYDGKFDWADREQRYIFNFALYPTHNVVVNTDLVKPGEIESYYDLLNPKWMDKIVINDPTVDGMGNSGFTAMAYHKMVDLDFFRKLAAQKNVMTRNQDLQVTWVAKGKYPIALWPSLGALSRFISAKAPVAPVVKVKEGTHAGSTGSALGFFNKAPHPNAAKVFINWFLSREGQDINERHVRKQTRRIDVPPEGLKEFEIRLPGVEYYPKVDEKEEFILTEAKKYDKLAKEIFAPLK
ncbi:MAG: extracellular solute-binding protein [Desulfobacterales bacterium]|nr:extracellular solute-binding protein [Desulfobacterales bacterium]